MAPIAVPGPGRTHCSSRLSPPSASPAARATRPRIAVTALLAGVALLHACGKESETSDKPGASNKLTIATVNNGDMIRMQGLTADFTAKNPGIEIEWVTLEENVLRQKVTTDIATKGGQFDLLTIGTYEVPDLGQARLADAARRSRRRLRRR